MRIQVLSDSHHDREQVQRALREQPDAQVVFHLGDGVRDMQELPELAGKTVLTVRGYEPYGTLPEFLTGEWEGVRYYACHGQAEHADISNELLLEKAREHNASLVLYGHTHEQAADRVNGVLLMNPGHLRRGEYGVIDITPQGDVTTRLLTMKKRGANDARTGSV